jgi:ferredoxin
LKVIGAATGALLVSLGMQNASVRNINAEDIPGAGHAEADSPNEVDNTYKQRVDSIEPSKFLSGCSRCGVCIQKCPFQAIKSESIAYPQLTDNSRLKCPGYENCGICAVVCPTDCLNDAFSDFDGDPMVEKPGWYEGPYEQRERQPGI